MTFQIFVAPLVAVLISAGLLAAAEPFPQPFNTEKSPTTPMPPEQTVAGMQMPPGFHLSVFAAEPEVQQPIAMVTDPRGRLWVAENYTYAERQTGYEEKLRDRIVVFEDTDNDGCFDKRTVFWEGAQRLISLEIGAGGVWALCLPQLLFLPDANGDDVPDGPPQVVLDGFDYLKGRHTMANGLRWGPDGWLYGRQGILTNSLIGAPGTPEQQRTAMNVGVWRYHPLRHTVEVVAEGTTNPWGMDWDENGEAFFINTVIGHLWHVIPGAHYRRMTGDDLDPRIYEVIEQHADHVHWATGEDWTDVRKGVSDATLVAGGGHAHTGLLIYQGGQWPAGWNGKLLTVNFHGRRLNVERLEREGTGYVGRREPDEFLFPDPWFRGIDLVAAPDGGVFISDWSDAGECHDHDGVHRTSGRIYKLTYGQSRPRDIGDLNQLPGAELARLQRSENDWLARQSRRVLANRAAAKQDQTEAATELQRMLVTETKTPIRLRALWALHVMGLSDQAQLRTLLSESDEHLRAWGLRLLQDSRHTPTSAAFSQLAREVLPGLAEQEQSGLVRLTLASLLQKLPVLERAPLAAALLKHTEDNGDHNQPPLLWCGILPLAEVPGEVFPRLIGEAAMPRVQRYGARRLAELAEKMPSALDLLLSTVASRGSPEARLAILDGLADGFSGRRQAPQPAVWDSVTSKLAAGSVPGLQDRVQELSALFGDGLALEALQAAALRKSNSMLQRKAALQALVNAHAPGLRKICETLLSERDLAPAAASGLAQFDDPALADRLVAAWPVMDGQNRSALMSTLVSRPAWVPAVLRGVSAGTLEKEKLTGFLQRQIRSYKVPELDRQLEAIFGKAPAAVKENAQGAATAKWKQRLTAQVLSAADRPHGRQVFLATCSACHTLNGEGGAIGPDLTGSARDNLDYLLENILYPSAVVPDDFRQVILKLKDGRVLAGSVKARTERTLRLQTITETISLETADIVSQEVSAVSLMPEGLLDALPEKDAQDLLAYLMSKEPLPR